MTENLVHTNLLLIITYIHIKQHPLKNTPKNSHQFHPHKKQPLNHLKPPSTSPRYIGSRRRSSRRRHRSLRPNPLHSHPRPSLLLFQDPSDRRPRHRRRTARRRRGPTPGAPRRGSRRRRRRTRIHRQTIHRSNRSQR